jgi:L-lactate dehydrogenase complex protein LldF
VKIDLDAQLFRWRQHVVESGYVSATKAAAIKSSVRLFDHPRLFRAAGALARLGLRFLPARLERIVGGPWARARELPQPPAQSFRAWYRANRQRGPR